MNPIKEQIRQLIIKNHDAFHEEAWYYRTSLEDYCNLRFRVWSIENISNAKYSIETRSVSYERFYFHVYHIPIEVMRKLILLQNLLANSKEE